MIDWSAVGVGCIGILPLIVYWRSNKFVYMGLVSLLAVAVHGVYFYGPNILLVMAAAYVVSTVAELTSLLTPIYCFGVRYRYNLKNPLFSSNINFFGVYPLEVTFAWVMFKYLSFNLVMIMASAFSLPTLAVMLLVPLVLVSLDFVIDPIAVNINKSWQWDSGSAYFGIPWQNFLGWYLVGLVAMVPYLLWEGMKPLVFHPLLILPVAFYAAVPPIGKLIKLDKVNGILGSIPVVLWVTLSAIGLVILYFR